MIQCSVCEDWFHTRVSLIPLAASFPGSLAPEREHYNHADAEFLVFTCRRAWERGHHIVEGKPAFTNCVFSIAFGFRSTLLLLRDGL